jgi:general secretion pathway protein K
VRQPETDMTYPAIQGVALVVVLWALVLLSSMAMSFIAYVRNEVKLTHNTHDTLRAVFMAEAGVYRGIATMLHSDPEKRWPVDGTVQRFNSSEGQLEVAVLAETGKIDVNYASSELLNGLFAVVNLPVDARKALVDAILDWRDADSVRGELGAEDADYYRMGLEYGAKDAPLTSVDELRLVPGMTQEVFNAVKQVLTVYSGSPSVNTSVAPVPVLAATYSGDISEAQRQVNRRRSNANKASSGAGYTGAIYSISSVAKTVSGSLSGVVATVSLNPGGKSSFKILNWETITEKCRSGMGGFACYG